jgi:chromosome segregation ATPase
MTSSAKHEAIKDIDRERSSIYKLKAQVENDMEKIHGIRDRAETAEFQNKRLLEANAHLTKELEMARDKARDLDRELHHKKESVDYFKGGFDRENDQLKRLEKQIETFKDQVAEHDRAKEEIRNQLEHKRRELVDTNHRHIREVESYQHLIERVS